MFSQEHYIPILKWKAAERRALKELAKRLTGKERKLITPLIQFVMPRPKPPKNPDEQKSREEQFDEVVTTLRMRLPAIPGEIRDVWGIDPLFVDVSMLYTPVRAESMGAILAGGETLGMSLIPVVNLSSDSEVGKASCSLSKRFGHGLCLRLVRADFRSLPELVKQLNAFVTVCGLPVDQIDLFVDLKEDDDNEYLAIIGAAQKIPNLVSWRTFTLASGAFPVDLTGCKVDQKNEIPRLEWQNWSRQRTMTMKRHPSFADYTIQHPVYNESAQFFLPSTSIRYTLKDRWLVMRGQKNKPKQYLANARILSDMPEYKGFGETFSYGDAQIKLKGADLTSKRTGNATTWLVIGINHHLACVTSQIARLPERPSTAGPSPAM